MTRIADPAVAAVFDSYERDIREALLDLRELIFAVADETPGVGDLEETLKWGQPSYVTRSPRSGTTIRLGPAPSGSPRYAMYVHCQTTLIATFRSRYADTFDFDGKRALVLDPGRALDVKALAECIAMALTYHLGKSRRRADEHEHTQYDDFGFLN